MNIAPIATFFVRLTGFSFLVDAVINLTYLLDYLAAAGSSKPGPAVDLHEFQAFMVVVRVLLRLPRTARMFTGTRRFGFMRRASRQ